MSTSASVENKYYNFAILNKQ